VKEGLAKGLGPCRSLDRVYVAVSHFGVLQHTRWLGVAGVSRNARRPAYGTEWAAIASK
jgi:hypothetical protein